MASTDEPSQPLPEQTQVDVVELDGLVVLNIIRHCQSALPSFVTGQLLGLDIGRTLEVTSCFPFPGKGEEEQGGEDEDGAEYQMEMMRCLRDVNVDSNTVGWYQSTYFSSFIEEGCIETQFNYQARLAAPRRGCWTGCTTLRKLAHTACTRSTLQCFTTAAATSLDLAPLLRAQENIKNCVVIIYDPSRTRATGMALRAFRLTDAFMGLYREGKFTLSSLASANMATSDVFQELPIKVRNTNISHTASPGRALRHSNRTGFNTTIFQKQWDGIRLKVIFIAYLPRRCATRT